MKHYQDKKRWRRILESWPVLIVLSALLFFFAYGVFGFAGKVRDTADNKENALAAAMELRERKAQLERDLELLDTDFGQERIFREDFGLARAGEGVIVLLDEPEEESVQEKEKGFFEFFRKLFKN